MSLALYRRYRPETFAEVIGQEHVTVPLQQALRNNRVNHAYLFSGPRGCGKTTSARILARCLNCEQGPTPEPCGECQSCRDLATGGPGSIDVIEIDAASHGGVDDARELRERAFFAPVHSRYKIFILDEAHMVTSAGFNALLKVVEEPPEHLKFIFATTEPEKVIGTIRSRTHHYPFRLVPPGTLRDYLAQVCGREGIQVEDSVFPLVVRAGAGSVRDSMSVMDQLLAGAADAGVTYQMATALLGYTDSSLLDEVVDAFAAQDGATVFQVIDRVVEGGHDPRRFVTDLLERLRDLVILATVPDAGEKGLIDAPADRIAVMQAQADRFGRAELSRAADLVNTGLTEMRGNAAPRLQLELICARVMLPGAYGDELSTQARLDKLERRAATGGFAAPMAFQPAPPMEAPAQQAPAQAPVQQAPAVAPPPAAAVPAPVPAPGPAPAPAGPAPGAWPIPRSFPPAEQAPPPAQQQPAASPVQQPQAQQPPAPQLQAAQPRPAAPRPAGTRAAGAGRRPALGGGTAGRGPDPADVAADPGGGEEPPPVHLDPAQPERPGRGLRRQHPAGVVRERGRPGQLRRQSQRRGAAAGADGRAGRGLAGGVHRRPVRRHLLAGRPVRRLRHPGRPGCPDDPHGPGPAAGGARGRWLGCSGARPAAVRARPAPAPQPVQQPQAPARSRPRLRSRRPRGRSRRRCRLRPRWHRRTTSRRRTTRTWPRTPSAPGT
ncbi:DNA polymerase III subunit gamma and tau [Kitasatospora cheerisanensis]|uniref:DNA polymerase III subunit gamma and tau n=1 Tax=Kitasatospora cheerisanensis TaxID=81942 RepID=UPI001FCC8EB2|nr:DNA polymerase III subunit gamma and tau [Kitasatospora cheerisanensis]